MVYDVSRHQGADSDKGMSVSRPTGHEHFAMLPGMWDRTITISSAGKTFSATGWQAS
jgi:aspartate/methionine/tyrosine aminotransferase